MHRRYNPDDYDLEKLKEYLIELTEVPAKNEIYWNTLMTSYYNLTGYQDFTLYNNYVINLYYDVLSAKGIKVIKLAKKLGVDINKYKK